MKKFSLFIVGFFWAGMSIAGLEPKGMIVIEPEALLWPNAIVPYQIDDAMPLTQQAEILKAMTLWEAETVVRFVRITPEHLNPDSDYVLFQPNVGTRCSSSVGRQGGVQVVDLASRCHTLKVAHELGHLIGLWHEQARLDRDKYIKVAWENIDNAHYHNFKKRAGEGQNQGSYDYDSIMHYSETAFSQNEKPTLIPRMLGVQIGQRTHLSAGDIASVNALYAKELKQE
ncbi:MAG: M12 family metallopeptidase [Legionella sp.]|nr:M12 family metallopeptidase [Legionella sp.]